MKYGTYAALRDKKGLNDYQVSKLTGIAASTFSDWKNGRSRPKIEKMVKIATALGVTVEALIEPEVGECISQ